MARKRRERRSRPPAGPFVKGYGRHEHETFAIEGAANAMREAGHVLNCDPGSVYALVRANRDLAQARAHLASIGSRSGDRTSKLWGVIQRAERAVDLKGNKIAKCLLK